MNEPLTITPIGKLVNLDRLIGAQVVAKPFDDFVFRNEMYVGVIDEAKISKGGTFVRFQTEALVGRKWLRLSQLVGFAHSGESQTTAA